MKIYLFNFAENTQNDQFHLKYDFQGKLRLVEEHLNYIANILNTPEYANTIDQPIRAIFVAPEYFFARSYPESYGGNIPQTRRGRHYEYTDYEEIRKALTHLSAREEFQKILIVPGTIAWKKPVVHGVASPVIGTSSYAPVAAWLPGVRINNKEEYDILMKSLGESPTEKSWRQYDKETPDSLILKTESLLRKDTGDLYGGSGLSVQHKKFIVGERSIDPEKYITELQDISFGLAYNTAFFYLGGKKVAEYSKHSDYQEILFGDAYKELNVALLSDGCSVLNIKGLTLGAEICLDHACDTLKTYLSKSDVFFSVGDFDSGAYCSKRWYSGENGEENKEVTEGDLLKESLDAYYRYRSFDGSVNKLYYFSRKSGPRDITNFIPIFDQILQVSYDGPTLRINGGIKAAGGGSYKEALTEERSLHLLQYLNDKGLNINRNWKPDIHLVLSACVQFKQSQAKYWFIHSSSQQDFNEPRNKFSRLRTNGAIFESDLIDLEELTPILELLRKMYKEGNGIGKDLKSMSEDEQIRLATILSLREKGQGFNLADNRFTRELKLGCQNVDSDGFCFFRAIAKQIMDRELNVTRHLSLTQLPTTMEEILEKVAVYFNEHSQELMDQIFPPPIRQNFGTGDRSEELYQEALREYNDTDERQRRLNGFRDNFYEYVNLGRYDTGGQLLNAADWLPQVMSNILQIDIDIYDGQRPGGGFRTNNGYGQQRIGLGRINNNHYISLNGNLEAAWLVEQNSVNLPSQESGVAHDHVRQKSQKQPEKKMENEGIPEQRVINDIERRDMSHPFKFTEYVRHAGRYARDNPLKTATIVAVAAGAYSYKSKKGCAIL